MQTQRTWVAQADLYGVAATVHCLLHGEYMTLDIAADENGVCTGTPKVRARCWRGDVRSC